MRILFAIATFVVVFWHADRAEAQMLGYAPCGVPLIAAAVPDAVASAQNGQPIILINPNLPGGPMLDFLIAHECGHHARGHISPQGIFLRSQFGGIAAMELDADCWAAQTVDQYIARAAIHYFQSVQGPSAGGPGYPSGFQRAQMIAQCSGMG